MAKKKEKAVMMVARRSRLFLSSLFSLRCKTWTMEHNKPQEACSTLPVVVQCCANMSFIPCWKGGDKQDSHLI